MFRLLRKRQPEITHADVQRFIALAVENEPLKPCPFCGAGATIAYGMYEHGPRFDACCNECDVSTESTPEIAWAIQTWNSRYVPQVEFVNTSVTNR